MDSQVDEVKSKVDIVSIIGERVELKKAGRNFKALCPFHQEKTASFMVSPELQIFKCFGCGKSGDVISFLEEYEGMEFYEALKYLAERVGVKLKPFKGEQRGMKEKIYEINQLALRFYSYMLTKHKIGELALKYLLVDRGLKPETIKIFNLGYSPDVPFALKNFLVDKKKIGIEELVSSGIVYKDGERVFDRFRGRIIFPLFDHRENVCGFAGRVLPGASQNLAKYINTPETEVYQKSKLLYGLNITKSEIKKKKYVVVVEGELDMISSWQTGIKNTVAIKGSALTLDQARLLSRYTKRIILSLDADIAGSEAARRGVEIAEKQGFEIKVAQLRGYKDPDEAVRKAPEKYKEALRNSVGVWDFLIDYIFSKYKGEKGLIKARISREVVPVLAVISDKIVQAHYIGIVAEKLGVREDVVKEELESKSFGGETRETEVVIARKDKKDRRELLEERLLSLCFALDARFLLKRNYKKFISTPFCKRLIGELHNYLKTNKEFDPSKFATWLPSEMTSGYINLILKELEGIDENDPTSILKELAVVRRELEMITIKEMREVLMLKIKRLESKKNLIGLRKAQEDFRRLSVRLNKIEEKNHKGIILGS